MGKHTVKVWLSTHRYTQKVLISAVLGSGPKPGSHAVQLFSASVIWYNLLERRGCPHLQQERAFPMSGLPAERKGTVGPGRTHLFQKVTKPH